MTTIRSRCGPPKQLTVMNDLTTSIEMFPRCRSTLAYDRSVIDKLLFQRPVDACASSMQGTCTHVFNPVQWWPFLLCRVGVGVRCQGLKHMFVVYTIRIQYIFQINSVMSCLSYLSITFSIVSACCGGLSLQLLFWAQF